MQKFERFLFFWGILTVTILFLSFGTMSPTPLNFISITSLLPLVFYFWIRLTSPQSVGADKWSIRFVVALTIFSVLGIYAFRLIKTNETSGAEKALKSQLVEVQKKNEELVNKLTLPSPTPLLDKKVATDEDESVADILYENPNGPITRKITSKSETKNVSVYQKADYNSQVIDTLGTGVNYPYLEKSDNWYKVVISVSVTGFVNADDVDEVI